MAGRKPIAMGAVQVEESGRPDSRRTTRKDGALEVRLAEVSAIRDDPSKPVAQIVLASALIDESSFVVAAAAEIVADAAIEGHGKAMVRSFHRFMKDPIASDKGCRAKTAIVRALLRTGEHDVGVYRAGVTHIQKEPAWGPPVDTAPELRGQSALGLARARDPGASVAIATLLADPEPGARTGAAQALAEIEAGVAIPLLRHKLLVDDTEPAVIAACYATLLAHDPEPTLALAAAYFTAAPDDFSEAVALALGESRLAGALPILVKWSETAERSSRQIAYVAMTVLRIDKAFDHLIDVIGKGDAARADDALRALANYRHDGKLRVRALAAAASRKDPALKARARELLGDG